MQEKTERAALFDVDGLLVDSETLDFSIFIRQLASVGIRMSLDDVREYTGVQNKDAYETIRRINDADFDVDKILARHYTAFEENITSVPVLLGAREIIRRCKSFGYKTGIVSGSPSKYVKSHLDRVGIDGFEVIITAEDVPSKPNPAGYLKAAEDLGIPTAYCMVFENSAHGIEAAKKAGCYVVGVKMGSNSKQVSNADYIASTLKQVETHLLVKFGTPDFSPSQFR